MLYEVFDATCLCWRALLNGSHVFKSSQLSGNQIDKDHITDLTKNGIELSKSKRKIALVINSCKLLRDIKLHYMDLVCLHSAVTVLIQLRQNVHLKKAKFCHMNSVISENEIKFFQV